jgi:hypothetical protein
MFLGVRETKVSTPDRCRATSRAAAIVFAALACTLAAPASAQGFFESLFGGLRRPAPPPHTNSYADPRGPFGYVSRRASGDGYSGGPTSGGGNGAAFCVRTCDGRYFPLQRYGGASPAELCKSFCPAAKTMVFSGSKIDYAVGPGGTRYADLDTAFAYRDKVVENCSCNGKDGLGLARVDTAEDPTLRPGDIVATNQGLSIFHGKNSRSAEFTPISSSSGEWARRLAEIKVRPAPPMAKIEPVAEDAAKPARKSRRVQATR